MLVLVLVLGPWYW